MKPVSAILRGAILGASLVAGAAQAAVYDFTFETTSGSPFTITGQVFTANTVDLLGGYDITAISGYVSGVGGGSIIGLVPNTNPPNQATSADGQFYFDNVAYISAPYLDNNGILFTAGSYEYNVYSTGSNTYYLSSWNPNGNYNPGQPGTLVAGVPELSTWALMLAGFAGLGFVGHRRTKNRTASLAA